MRYCRLGTALNTRNLNITPSRLAPLQQIMSSVRQLKKWLFGRRQVQVQIVGGDGAGKTTMLYTLKNRGGPPAEHPNPLMPYNRETIEHPTGWEFDIVDVWEGCSKFNLTYGPFHFMTSESLIWYIHDCSLSDDSITLSIPEYIRAMREKGAKYLWVLLSKQDKLALPNKSEIVAKHREKLVSFLEKNAAPVGITWYVVDEPGFNLLEGRKYVLPFVKGVTQILLELEKKQQQQRLQQQDQAISNSIITTTTNTKGARDEEARKISELKALGDEALRARLEKVERSGQKPQQQQQQQQQQQDVDLFWENFLEARLTSWTHVDHLEAGYLVLLRSMELRHGLLKTAGVFLEHLARLRSARPDVFRNTAHFTMTAFWIIQLRIATFNFQFEAEGQHGAVPMAQDFRGVLLHTPALLDTRLWMQYYTKEVLFSPAAREDFVMPDLQPFPQVTKPVLSSMMMSKEE